MIKFNEVFKQKKFKVLDYNRDLILEFSSYEKVLNFVEDYLKYRFITELENSKKSIILDFYNNYSFFKNSSNLNPRLLENTLEYFCENY